MKKNFFKHGKRINPYHRAPFYTFLIPKIRRVITDLGYTLALHGSMNDDLDVIAIPWRPDAVDYETVAEAIFNAFKGTIFEDVEIPEPWQMPHGRIAYILPIHRDWVVDLSIIKRWDND